MKKPISIVLFLFILCLTGCVTINKNEELPLTDHTSGKGSNQMNEGIIYNLTVNKETVTKNNLHLEAGDIVFAINEKISEAEGKDNFLSTALHEAIIDIDYPAETVLRDGTVVSSQEYHLKEVPAGQIIHITITKELQERLALESDVLEIKCE